MDLQTLQFTPSQSWSQALPSAMDSEHTLVPAFGAPKFADEPIALAELTEAFPKAIKLGCSTLGEIHGAEVHDASLSVAVARFDHARLRCARAAVTASEGSRAVGIDLARQLADADLRAVFVLSDGPAGDGTQFKRTRVFDGEPPQPALVCAVGSYGERVRAGFYSHGEIARAAGGCGGELHNQTMTVTVVREV